MNSGRAANELLALDGQDLDLSRVAPIMDTSISDPQDPYNAFVAGDLDTFFGDIASLHGPKKFQNNPQFMQNLGYSSEISMADLLSTDSGRFMPLSTSNMGTDNTAESPQFPLPNFYDVG